QWQSTYGPTGWQTNLYNPGNATIAPFLGNANYNGRGVWWNGADAVYWVDPSGNPQHQSQDDLSIITNSTNAFGYRTDDHGNSATTAAALTVSGNTATGSGIIETAADVDFFSFTTTGGLVSFSERGAQFGQMLDAKVQVFNAAGQQVAIGDTANLNETF